MDDDGDDYGEGECDCRSVGRGPDQYWVVSRSCPIHGQDEDQ